MRLAIFLLSLTIALPAAAQRRPIPRPHQDTAEQLAALGVHEDGWDHPDMVAGILAVWRHIAETRHVEMLYAAHQHSRRFYAGTSTRPWVLWLTREGRKPQGMDATWLRPRVGAHGQELPSRHDQWLVYLAAATAALEAPSVCVADTWGNDDDWTARSAQGLCYAFVDCGDTSNRFGVWRRCDSTEPGVVHPGDPLPPRVDTATVPIHGPDDGEARGSAPAAAGRVEGAPLARGAGEVRPAPRGARGGARAERDGRHLAARRRARDVPLARARRARGAGGHPPHPTRSTLALSCRCSAEVPT